MWRFRRAVAVFGAAACRHVRGGPQELAASEAWKSALARAQGERVLDDPKLLRRSLKKETKQKAKSRDAWQERTRKETEKKDATQKKWTPPPSFPLDPSLSSPTWPSMLPCASAVALDVVSGMLC